MWHILFAMKRVIATAYVEVLREFEVEARKMPAAKRPLALVALEYPMCPDGDAVAICEAKDDLNIGKLQQALHKAGFEIDLS